MKSDIRYKMAKTNFILGICLVIIGILMELEVFNYSYSEMNLKVTEVNTIYNDSPDPLVKQIAYTISDTSWAFPTSGNYYITSSYNNYHPAIDIVTTDNNLDIYSAYDGYVVTDSYKFDGGNYLIIKQDNGYYTLYCHLSDKKVSVNQRVSKGQVIGTMGRTGFATGIHLHFSIWNGYPYYNSSHINPFNFY